MSKCPHVMSTLVATLGLGTWDVTEVYRCNACGARIEHKVDTSYSPDSDDYEPDGEWSEHR